MSEALLAGAVAAGPLVLGALLSLVVPLPRRAIGLLLAFGAGTLVSAVSFELADEAISSGGVGALAGGLAAGALVFYAGDRWLETRSGRRRPHRPASRITPGRDAEDGDGREGGGEGATLVLGGLLDGVPEQLALGISIAAGGEVSVALVAAIALSNIPEAWGSGAELRGAWSGRRIVAAWAGVALAGLAATLLGYGILDEAPDLLRGGVLAFAAGAVLVMLVDSMIPEASRNGGRAAGIVTVLGFALAVLLSQTA